MLFISNLSLALALSAPPYPTKEEVAQKSDPQSDFRQVQPCPSTGRSTGSCPGWKITYIKPLECRGKDEPANMRWRPNNDYQTQHKALPCLKKI